MRSLFVLMLLAACELKPPPPKAQPAAGSAPGSAALAAKAPAAAVPAPPQPLPIPVPAPAPAPVANAGSGSAVPIPPPAISDACATVAAHFTDILITNADPTQRAFMEQERGKLVQRTALSCARNNWNDDKIKCYTTATKYADLDNCNKLP